MDIEKEKLFVCNIIRPTNEQLHIFDNHNLQLDWTHGDKRVRIPDGPPPEEVEMQHPAVLPNLNRSANKHNNGDNIDTLASLAPSLDFDPLASEYVENPAIINNKISGKGPLEVNRMVLLSMLGIRPQVACFDLKSNFPMVVWTSWTTEICRLIALQ